jgi:hypothetical protein
MSKRVMSSVAEAATGSDYQTLELLVASRIKSALAAGPVFVTDVDPDKLWEAYLNGIPVEYRQHYTCNACRRFIQSFGGLVTIDPVNVEDKTRGMTEPIVWTGHSPAEWPEFFRGSILAMRKLIMAARVRGVFLSSDKVLGTPTTGEWSHLCGTNPKPFYSPLKTAEQVSAEKLQDYIILKQALKDYSLSAAQQAVRVLEADVLDRSEKTLGVAKWFLDLHMALEPFEGRVRDNIIWKSVATAPPGWCHIRSTMISTLLDDIVAGLPFDHISARWAAKMHPLKYQRPITIKGGNIEQATEIIKKLGAEGSLKRRFAKMDDVLSVTGGPLGLGTLWTPKTDALSPEKPAAGGPFDHLRARTGGKGGLVKEVELPPIAISWVKFAEMVLPSAREIEFRVPAGRHGYFGLVTAAVPESPPILQWDGLEGQPRNSVSWYFYHGGSPPSTWGLVGGTWVKVKAITRNPAHWQQPDKFKHIPEGAFLILDGAKDASHEVSGGFFPESLRTEFHGIRSVIEGYSVKAKIEGKEEGDANGISISSERGKGLGEYSPDMSFVLRVKTPGGMSTYSIPRWE